MLRNIQINKWLAVCIIALLVALALYFFPVSTRMTRLTSVICAGTLWLGLIGLTWNKRLLRVLLCTLTILIGGFLALPARALPPGENLRQAYTRSLQRYTGCPYYWGGETARGIDCSGLVRRGLIDALALEGLKTGDAGLVRRAISLWWHDCTARVLGDANSGLTARVLQTRALNELDHSQLLPGDLAVTSGGVHVMAYLGDRRWIEADPEEMRVLQASAPAEFSWFVTPMQIVRWEVLR